MVEFISPPHLPMPTKVSLTVAYVANCLASLFGNWLVIHVVKKNRTMKTTMNFLIVNLSCADLLATALLTCYSIKFVYTGLEWISSDVFGEVSCKVMYYILMVSFFSSVFSIIAITIDRFLGVTRPLRHKSLSRWTKVVLLFIWSMALIVPTEELLSYTVIVILGKPYCLPIFERPMTRVILFSVLCFLVPLVFMIVLYSIIAYRLCTRHVPGEPSDHQRRMASRTARKVTTMMVTVIVVFVICWAPLFVVSAGLIVAKPSIWLSLGPFFLPLSLWLCMCNAWANPCLYALFNENFRREFRQTLRGCHTSKICCPWVTTRVPSKNRCVATGGDVFLTSVKPRHDYSSTVSGLGPSRAEAAISTRE